MSIAPSEGRPSSKIQRISILRVDVNLEATGATAAPSPAPTATWTVILLVCLIASSWIYTRKSPTIKLSQKFRPETWVKAEPADASDTADPPSVPAAASADPPEEAAEHDAAEGGLLGRLREKVAPTVQRVAEMESPT